MRCHHSIFIATLCSHIRASPISINAVKDKVRSAKMQSSYFDPPRKESFATGSTADTVSLYDDLDTPELTAEDEAELMIAIQNQEMDRQLLPDGVNAAQTISRYPLHYASNLGNGRIVKMLIKQSRNVDEQDFQGNTPLIWAAVGNHLEIVKLLIDEYEANIWAENSDGVNVFQYLLRHHLEEATNKYVDVISFLLRSDNGMYPDRYEWPYQKLRGAKLTGVDSLRI